MIKALNNLKYGKFYMRPIYLQSNKKYILSQFPYPSGELHLGHARVYYIGDTLSRYYRLRGEQVIYPIGWDSFGLPAQNAAILHGKNPQQWTEKNISQMKKQLQSLEIEFNWEREFATSRPQYYRWTQQIFTKMFKEGLAYQSLSEVNWDPVDKTVLANEQVDNLGRSWRSGALVEKKMLKQWFFKITKYAEELQNELRNLNWIDRVKSMQAGWIGHQRGFVVKIKVLKLFTDLQELAKIVNNYVEVFVKDLNQLSDEDMTIRFNIPDKKSETLPDGSVLGEALHPLKGTIIKIILGREQNGITAEILSSKTSSIIEKSIIKQITIQQKEVMRIRDWSISRQRYWGTPIPIIYCPRCGVVPVPDENLPVILPQWQGCGNPLHLDEFKKCSCPNCGSPSQRQTDTMDTFVDSSWYFLRFLDPINQQQLCRREKADFMMPVDIYIGGIEHAIMHLLYARFFMRFLADQEVCKYKEPFKELVVQGLVKGKTIRHRETGRYLKPSERDQFKEEELEESYQKMSKSKFNGLNPTELVDAYGPDELRIALFFAAPPENDVDFNQEMLVSAGRFLKKFEQLSKNIDLSVSGDIPVKKAIESISLAEKDLSFRLKSLIYKMEQSLEKRLMHVYVASCMEIFHEIASFIRANPQQKINAELFGHILLPIIQPMAPKLTKSICPGSLRWPDSTYFETEVQFLVMKGSKKLQSGRITLHQSTEDLQILQKLKLSGTPIIKRSKKNILIIFK